jgi:hypothetical protein
MMKIVQFNVGRLKCASVFVKKGLIFATFVTKILYLPFKKYHISRHYEVKHATQLSGTEGRLSWDKTTQFQRVLLNSKVYSNYRLRARQSLIVALFPNS